MTRDRDDLRRLHFINALFAHATGHDLYLAEQIKGAITFSLAELAAPLALHPNGYATIYGHFPDMGYKGEPQYSCEPSTNYLRLRPSGGGSLVVAGVGAPVCGHGTISLDSISAGHS